MSLTSAHPGAPEGPGAEGRTRPRVVVLGGGIAGLASAVRLAPHTDVTVLEASDQLGGLGTFVEVDGDVVERFYHCVMPTDESLLPLLEQVGARDRIRWRHTTMGMVVGGRRYPFTTPLDLLRFSPISLWHRVRLGVGSLLLRRLGQGKDLDHVRTEDWLRGVFGDALWERVWRPLFRAKFGDHVGEVPALYLWERLGRESNGADRGYPVGGYRGFTEALHEGIEGLGGEVRVGTPVVAVREVEPGGALEVELGSGEVLTADWVLSTTPLPLLGRLVEGDAHLSAAVPDVRLPHTGVVNVLFFTRKPLDGHYWTPVLESGTDFDGVVQMSALTGTEHTSGRHLTYAMRYCSADSELYGLDDATVAERWTDQLVGLYADLVTTEDVVAVRVFRTPFVEPTYPLGYATSKPSAEVPGTRLVLATTAQVYPRVTAWNSSAALAAEVVDGLLARAGVAR